MYGNANVANYLSSGNVSTNILTTANVSASGNVTGDLVLEEESLKLASTIDLFFGLAIMHLQKLGLLLI